MKKPQNIIETKEYVEPHTFENDSEAVLFYAYIELQKYVDSLEQQLNNLLKPDVIGSVCDCGANGCLITVCSRCCRNYTGAA
jgi:hypothetical protein